MDLRELRRQNTHESRTILIDALEKLRVTLVSKVKSCEEKYDFQDYFKKLGCESKYGPMPYKDGPDHICVTIWPASSPKYGDKWQVKVPVETAEKILVLGLP